jgi:hypothetical protein
MSRMPRTQSTPARTARRHHAVIIAGIAGGLSPPVTRPIETPARVAKRIEDRPSTTAR